MKSQRQFLVVVAVIKDTEGRILVAKRLEPDNPAAHNKWELPGGTIDFGEDPEDTLIREAEEETGLAVKPVRLLPKVLVNTWDLEAEQQQVILLHYECEIIGGKLKTESLDPEIAELKFVSMDEAKTLDGLPNFIEGIELLNSK